MKYIIPSIAMIILLGTACDKYDISSKQSETFIRFYGVGLEDGGMKVITTNEGYLIMANVENPGSGRDICIITTDEYGNTTSPVTTIGGAFDDIGYAIKPNGGGYIIAGSTQASENSDKDVYVIQLGSNGTVVWDKPIRNDNNNEAYDVLVEDDGELVFTGYTETGESTQQRDILFIKTNATADVFEYNQIGRPTSDEEAHSIVLWRDTTFIFAGYQRSITGTKDIYLLRWEGWKISAPTKGLTINTEGNSEAKCIINTSTQGRFLIACNNELSSNQSDILLLETDFNLDEHSIISQNLGERSMNRVQSMAIHGNSLYLCGTSSGELEYGDMLLIKLTAAGTNPQYHYIGDGASYTGSGFDLTKENGYVITGASYRNEKSMITLYKVNNEGTL